MEQHTVTSGFYEEATELANVSDERVSFAFEDFAANRLTESERREFAERGFVIVKDVLPLEQHARLLELILELCEHARFVAAGEPPFVRKQIETGYFAMYDKPVDAPIFSLHNDNHARAMGPNPRVLSLVLHLNEPARNALTVFPIARRPGAAAGADPTDALSEYLRDERQPPKNAVKGTLPEPWWRFITRQARSRDLHACTRCLSHAVVALHHAAGEPIKVT